MHQAAQALCAIAEKSMISISCVGSDYSLPRFYIARVLYEARPGVWTLILWAERTRIA